MQAETSGHEKTPPRLYSLLEAHELLGVSRSTLYRLLDDEKILSVYLRGRRMVPAAEITKFIERQLAEQAGQGA